MSDPICKVEDIEIGNAKGFELSDTSILIIRRDNGFFAYKNSCPHRGIRLEWQPDTFLDFEKQFIQCATHGALFTIESGECIAGPCPGEMLDPVKLHIQDGMIYLHA